MIVKIWDIIKKYWGIVPGTLMTAVGVSLFLLPNKIITGGVSGVSTLLYHALGIEPGLSSALINIVLLLVGIKILGKAFIVKTLVGSMLVSVFIQIFAYMPPATSNVLLAAIFGAMLYGVGIAITFVSGASTGGTDIVGRIAQHFMPHLSIGSLLLAIDGVIIVTSLCIFRDFDLLMFSVIALVVSTYSIDYIIQSLNISKLVFVVSEKGSEISQKLVATSPRGVTKIDVWGEYTNEKKMMLLCALKNKEVPAFKRKVREIDPGAFIILAEAQHVDGKGFLLYK
ncbi:MAG: YitT family protein [Clostridia bacterium]|nr:YitT family protein [Clostridia bacterium]